MIVAVPGLIPLTVPLVISTDAIPTALLVHSPSGDVLDSNENEPEHAVSIPVIEAGRGLTVIPFVA